MSKDKTERDDDRVTLAPLDPQEALRALLAVKPDDEDDDQPGEGSQRG